MSAPNWSTRTELVGAAELLMPSRAWLLNIAQHFPWLQNIPLGRDREWLGRRPRQIKYKGQFVLGCALIETNCILSETLTLHRMTLLSPTSEQQKAFCWADDVALLYVLYKTRRKQNSFEIAWLWVASE